jgi:hypothetical protein
MPGDGMRRTIQQELGSILTRPITTPEEAEAAQEAAGLLATYLRLERRVGELRDHPAQGATGHPNGDLRGTTLDEAARAVLQDAGVPLHARELGARIKARGWRHPRSKVARPDQIVYQLAARLPRDPAFRRVAPNTFALAEWDEGSENGDAGEGRPVRRRPRPRVGLFHGGGRVTGRLIAESDEPFASKEPGWRSS